MNKVILYSHLSKLRTYKERLEYAMVNDHALYESTIGSNRYLAERFYNSEQWRRIRRHVIIRDSFQDYIGDLGAEDVPIIGRVTIHHMIPLTAEDFLNVTDRLTNPEFLICVSDQTHKALHYGLPPVESELIFRKQNDTCPWR